MWNTPAPTETFSTCQAPSAYNPCPMRVPNTLPGNTVQEVEGSSLCTYACQQGRYTQDSELQKHATRSLWLLLCVCLPLWTEMACLLWKMGSERPW